MRALPARFLVSIGRDRTDPDHIVVRVRKSWWGGHRVGQLERNVCEVWTNVAGLGETEACRAGLYDAWLALADELS